MRRKGSCTPREAPPCIQDILQGKDGKGQFVLVFWENVWYHSEAKLKEVWNMGVVNVILSVVLILAALFMIVTVLLQSSNVKGLGAVAGQMDSYFSKNKAKTVEAKLALGTKIAAGVFVVLSLLMLVLNRLA